MPNARGLPMPGEEVLFPDGRTETIKTYHRSRIVGYADSKAPRMYSEDEASEPVTGYVVEMARPYKQEFVTLITFLPSGFWQAMNIATPFAESNRDAADAMVYAIGKSRIPAPVADGDTLVVIGNRRWWPLNTSVRASFLQALLWSVGYVCGYWFHRCG